MKNFGNRIPSLEELERINNPYSDLNSNKKLESTLNIKLSLESLPGVGAVKNGKVEKYMLLPFIYTPNENAIKDIYGNLTQDDEKEKKSRYIITNFIKHSNQKALTYMGDKALKLEDYLDNHRPKLTKAQIFEYIHKHGWERLCIDNVLDEKFIENWIEFMDIGVVLRNQPLSIDFLYELRHEIRAENLPSVIDNQEWYMFTKFLIMKSKDKASHLHVNRKFFNEFRNKLHAQKFKEINFNLSHSKDEVVRHEGVFQDKVKIYSYTEIPENVIICNEASENWRNCDIAKTFAMRENETLWELNVDLKLDNLDFFTIFE